MIVSIYKTIRSIFSKIKLFFIEKEFRNKATFLGKGQNFGVMARIRLLEGAKKENIILYEHSEVFGTITALHNGKIKMLPWAKIGQGSSILASNYVEIGKDTAIADNVTIIDNNNHPTNPDDRRYMRHTPHDSWERQNHLGASAPIIIGENVLVGSNSRICKGVRIGDNAIIAACAVVTKDVPANSIAAGNPARIVKENIDKTTSPIFVKK